MMRILDILLESYPSYVGPPLQNEQFLAQALFTSQEQSNRWAQPNS
jgi:hypothetical protein